MKSNKAAKPNFQPIEGIRWLRSCNEITFIKSDLSKGWALKDIEADVWEWMWQEFNQQSIIKMIALMTHSTENQALQQLNNISARWEEQGLIQRTQTD